MVAAMRPLVLLGLLAAALVGCGEAEVSKNVYLRTSDDGAKFVDDSLDPGHIRLKNGLCEGVSLTPEYGPLTEDDLIAYLEKQGFRTTKRRARRDLVYVDVAEGEKDAVRLRVAILETPPAAGRELHEAILQHGPGAWGVHRSNLAVLAPIGSPGQIVGYAMRTKLACWGVLTLAGLDDTFVVPGAYIEL
jgi:hypothetical protein